jgi:hypothetical protein
MAEPTMQSPNVGNLQVGKGNVTFQKNFEGEFRHLGNCTAFTVTPEVETLEHFSSMEGTRKKDLVITIEQRCTVAITMEEFTAFNLALMTQGALDEAAVGGPEVEIFGATEAISGHLRFTGTNDVGPKITIDLYNVQFAPDGDLEMISDEFNAMEVTADVLVAPTGSAFVGKFGVAKFTNVTEVS